MMLELLLFIIIIIFLTKIVGNYFTRNRLRKIFEKKKILLVIAHPDDETLFFSQLFEIIDEIHVLCLSTGNYDGYGYKRKSEIYEACKVFNINEKHVYVSNDYKTRDNPKNLWCKYDVVNTIKKYENKGFNGILTFDKDGYTEHKNHISCYNGVKEYCMNNGNIEMYTLSTPKITHFLPFTFMYCFYQAIKNKTINENILVSYNKIKILRAFAKYETQYSIKYTKIINCLQYFYYILYSQICDLCVIRHHYFFCE